MTTTMDARDIANQIRSEFRSIEAECCGRVLRSQPNAQAYYNRRIDELVRWNRDRAEWLPVFAGARDILAGEGR
jgi:hypothetical protein